MPSLNDKQVNVNLSFTADTNKAKVQIKELRDTLFKLTTTSKPDKDSLAIAKEIKAAITEVTKLDAALKQATTDTGKLDLGQFNKSLNSMGLSAEKIKTSLMALGPEGQAAFSKLAQSISMAEIPLKRTNGLLTQFATTLKNSARWTISSSIVHGILGSMQTAYRYSQDLDKSLNNIRIVSGQSAEQMAEFARQANNAAKALNTTTTAYTDAALIFYQQGLSDEAVKDRTEVVLKMSNVTGEAVKDVSSYLTAIWNNFDDGSQSLEHYADVITALGAATASSSEEIANGLEKFASIGQTVGLSYDYATAALATVVSATRQSEDVVGNAFKTIFSRIQGLKLGETLEDDVDLNKYSAALRAVGVEVVTSSGELRDLDRILDDLASKWNNLTNAQQTALAQTVAGTRQYSQFISLMSNWDSMTRNLEIARSSEGSLQEQADIYAESWEAARKNVKASMQTLYDDLLDDKFFIKLTDNTAKVLDTIHELIEAIGGLKGVIPVVSLLFLKLFNNDISKGIDNFIYNIQLASKTGQEAIIKRKQEFNDALVEMAKNAKDLDLSKLYQQQGNIQNSLIEKTIKLNAAGKDLSETEKAILKDIQDQNQALLDQYKEKLKIAKDSQYYFEQSAAKVKNSVGVFGSKKNLTSLGLSNLSNGKDSKAFGDEVIQNTMAIEAIQRAIQNLKDSLKDGQISEEGAQWVKVFTKQLENSTLEIDKTNEHIRDFWLTLKTVNGGDSLENVIKEFEELCELGSVSGESIDTILNKLEQVDNELTDLNENRAVYDNAQKQLNQINKKLDELIAKRRELKKAIDEGTATNIQKEDYNKLQTDISKLAKQRKIYNKELETSSVKVENLSEKTQGLSRATSVQIKNLENVNNEINSQINQAENATNAYLDAANGMTRYADAVREILGANLTFGQGITATAQSLTGLSMGISQIINLFDIWDTSAENFDAGKALLQTMTSIGMAIPMLINGYKNLAKVMSPLTAEFIAQKIAVKEKAFYEALEIPVLSNLSKANEQQIKQIVSLVTAEEYEKVTKGELSAATVLQTHATEVDAQINNADTAAVWKLVAAKDAEEKANYRVATSMMATPYGWALAILAAVAATITIVVKAYDKYQEKLESSRKKEFELNQEKIEAIEKNNELVSSYNKLISTMEEQGEISESLFETIIQLADAYDIVGARILALTGNYKALSNEVQQNQLESLNEQLYEINDNLDKAFKSGVKAGKGNLFTQAIKEFAFKKKDISANSFIFEAAKETDSKITNVREAKNIQDLLEYKNYLDYAIKRYEQFPTSLVGDITGQFYTEKEVYEQLLDAKERLEKSELFSQAESLLDKKYSTEVNIKFLEEGLNIDTTFDELVNIKQKVANELNGIIPDDEIDNYIYKYLKGLGYLEDEVEKLNIADTIAKQTDKGLNDVLDLIKDFDKHGLAYLSIHLNTTLLTTELKDWLDDNEIIFKTEQEKSISNELKEAIKTYDSKEGFEGVDLSELFTDEEVSSKIGISKEQFDVLDEADKLSILTDAWIKATKSTENYKEESITTLTDEATKLDEEIKAKEIFYQLENIKLNQIIGKTKTYAESQETLKNIILKAADPTQRLSETEQVMLNTFSQEVEVDKDILKGLAEKINNYNNLEESLKITNQKLEEYKNKTNNSKEYLKYLNGQMKAHNIILDDIQSTYQTLIAIIQDYNETGHWTVDNVQKLMEMSDSFVATLDVQENSVSLNEQAFQNLTLAKIDDLRQTALNIYYEELLRISELDVAQAAAEAGAAALLSGDNIEIMGDKALSTADKLLSLADSYKEAKYSMLSEDQEALADVARQALKNRLQAAEGLISEIKTGGSRMQKAMGVKDSKSKEKDTKDLKKYLDEFDRFYPIKKAIEDVSDALSDLSKQQQHLAGKALANSLKEQNKLLQNQAELYKELLKEQEDYRNELAGTLASFGMTFDAESGNITNYAAATQSALERYNQAIIAYNASAQDEVAKATLKTAEEEYNAFKNTLSKYQSILKDIESTANNIDDIFYKQIENNLKAFEVEIKLNLDIEDTKRKVLDFIQEINTDFKKVYKTTEEWTKLFDVAASKARTFTEEEGTINTDLKALKEVSSILDNPDYNYGSEDSLFASKSDAINKYKELTETLMTDSKALYDLYQSSWQNYLSAVDQVENKWNDVIDDFDRVGKSLDHTTKITELLYGGSDTEAGRDYLDQIYGAKSNSSLAKQTALKEEILALQKEYDEIIAAGASADEEDVKKIAKAIEDANDKLDSEIESYLETIQNKLTNSIKSIMTNADKAMTGGYGVDKLIEEWNDAKAAEEGYYDDVQRTYQLQTAENKWKDLINSTSRIKDQQYLKKIMDSQLDNLKQKTKLSEYDVQLAEKELNIQKAYIALQNAQSNKNSMKLVRNQQGNWTYNYVADQDDIANKQQDFLDALNEKYEFTKTESDKAYEKVLNLYQTANEKLTALMNEYVNADETRRAEIEVEYNELYQKYYGEGGLIENAANEAAGKNEKYLQTWGEATVGYYSNDAQSFKDMTDLQKGYLESLFGSDSKEGAAQKSISKTFGENGSGLETFGKFCEALTGEDKGIYKQILDGAANCVSEQDNKWTTLTKGIVDSWATGHTGKDGQESVQDVITGAYNAIKDKVGQYDQAIKDSENASGKNWSDVKKAIDDAAGATDTAKQKTEDLIKETDQLSTFRQAVDAIGVAWNGVKDSIEAAVSALDDYLKLLKEDTGKPQTPDYSTSTVGTGSGYVASDNSGNGNVDVGKTEESPKGYEPPETDDSYTWRISEEGTGVNTGSYNDEGAAEDAIKDMKGTVTRSSNHVVYYTKPQLYKITNKGGLLESKLIYADAVKALEEWRQRRGMPNAIMEKMATGGYTGDWNSSEGRLAILHEKELVLNKEDTSNILNAVNLVRGISNISDLVSNAISSNLAGMALSLTGLGSSTINRNISNNNSSNNTFNITAEFPNAGNVEEIREAILSLPNLAAQYLAQK